MKKVWLGVALASFALLLSACSSPEKKVIGKWKGEVAMPKSDDPGSQMANAMASMFASAINLELKSDKTFTLNLFISIEGTWSMAGNTVTLTPKAAAGMDSAKMSDQKPIELELSGDGKTLTAKPDDSSKDQGSLTFKKEEGS